MRVIEVLVKLEDLMNEIKCPFCGHQLPISSCQYYPETTALRVDCDDCPGCGLRLQIGAARSDRLRNEMLADEFCEKLEEAKD